MITPASSPALVRRLRAGALAGFGATGAMTVGLTLMLPLVPARERYALPPRRLTGAILRRVGWQPSAGAEEAVFLTAHYGYGMLTGAGYGATFGRSARSAASSGILYALLVWAGSYQGWIPAFRFLRPAFKRPTSRNVLMIAGHLVWGAALGGLYRLWLADRRS